MSSTMLKKKDDVVTILGIPVNRITMEELLRTADDVIASRDRLLLGVVNVAKVVNARKNNILRQSLTQADLIVADGLPLVWLSRWLGDPLPGRITGIDIMFRLLKRADERHYSVYFLGAKPDVLREVVRIVQRDYPGLRVAGYRDGYFKADEEMIVAEEVRDSRADILFVAISPPKKEIFLRKWGEFMNTPICHGVGGSFDVLAGVTRRAPVWMQKYGLEWSYRLIQEPRRMWKRYLITNAIFVKLCVGAVLHAKLGRLFRKSERVTTSEVESQNSGDN